MLSLNVQFSQLLKAGSAFVAVATVFIVSGATTLHAQTATLSIEEGIVSYPTATYSQIENHGWISSSTYPGGWYPFAQHAVPPSSGGYYRLDLAGDSQYYSLSTQAGVCPSGNCVVRIHIVENHADSGNFNLGQYAEYFIVGGEVFDVDEGLPTKIYNITPPSGSTTLATQISSFLLNPYQFTIGADVYVSPNDYTDNMYLSVVITDARSTQFGSGYAIEQYSWVTGEGTEVRFPLAEGYNYLSTSTTVIAEGTYFVDWYIRSDDNGSDLGSLWGQIVSLNPFDQDTYLSTTTILHVNYDDYEPVDSQVPPWATTTSSQLSVMCDRFPLDVLPCLKYIIWPETRTLAGLFDAINIPFLSRTMEILKETRPVPLPTISYEFSDDMGVFSNMDFEFDPWQYFYTDGAPVKDLWVSDRDEPKNIWQIFQTPVTWFVYLYLLYIILNDLTGIFGVSAGETQNATTTVVNGKTTRIRTRSRGVSKRINL